MSGTVDLWEQVFSGANSGRYSVTSDATRGHSGRYAAQILYSPTTSSDGMLLRRFMPGYDDVYIKFYTMFEENFEHAPHFVVVCGNIISDDGSCFGRAGTVPKGNDWFYAGIEPEYHGDELLYPLDFYTYWPDMNCCYGNYLEQTAPKIPLIGGQWQEVVYHIKMNDPGQYNGYQELWVDGQKKIVQQNMRWRTTTDLRINMLRFDVWTQSAPKIEHVWIDDVTIWRP